MGRYETVTVHGLPNSSRAGPDTDRVGPDSGHEEQTNGRNTSDSGRDDPYKFRDEPDMSHDCPNFRQVLPDIVCDDTNTDRDGPDTGGGGRILAVMNRILVVGRQIMDAILRIGRDGADTD